MKKLRAIALLLLLIFALSACGETASPSTDTATTDSQVAESTVSDSTDTESSVTSSEKEEKPAFVPSTPEEEFLAKMWVNLETSQGYRCQIEEYNYLNRIHPSAGQPLPEYGTSELIFKAETICTGAGTDSFKRWGTATNYTNYNALGSGNYQYWNPNLNKDGTPTTLELYSVNGTDYVYAPKTNQLSLYRNEKNESWRSPTDGPLVPLKTSATRFWGIENTVKYLSDKATVTEGADGLRTLRIPLTRNQIYENFYYDKQEHEDASELYVEFTVDKDYRLITLTYQVKVIGEIYNDYVVHNNKVIYQYDYSTPAAEVPSWLNVSDPFAGKDGGKAYYWAENMGTCILNVNGTLSVSMINCRQGEGIVIPSDFPVQTANLFEYDCYYKDSYVLTDVWNPQLTAHKDVTVYVRNTERPKDSDAQNIFFKGEWESINGVPKAK